MGVPTNTLYYGDNLDILRRYVADESVDLVYLDPPFNSNANYNVLFAEQDGEQAAAQIQAFEDTWTWDLEAELALRGDDRRAAARCRDAMQAFRKLLGTSDMLAYLAMMAPRLVELRRVLKPTGSIYLHCDPTASHYLKLLMDAVFGPEQLPERDRLEADQRSRRTPTRKLRPQCTTSCCSTRRATQLHVEPAVRAATTEEYVDDALPARRRRTGGATR